MPVLYGAVTIFIAIIGHENGFWGALGTLGGLYMIYGLGLWVLKLYVAIRGRSI